MVCLRERCGCSDTERRLYSESKFSKCILKNLPKFTSHSISDILFLPIERNVCESRFLRVKVTSCEGEGYIHSSGWRLHSITWTQMAEWRLQMCTTCKREMLFSVTSWPSKANFICLLPKMFLNMKAWATIWYLALSFNFITHNLIPFPRQQWKTRMSKGIAHCKNG